MKINKNIESVNSISSSDFDQRYFKPQKPVQIKALANLYPAGRKWTINYLKAYCGDVEVEIFDSSSSNNSSAYTRPDFKMMFKDYIDLIIREEPSDLRIFLFNMFRRKPGLKKYFPCPYLFKGILGRIGYMFFGSKNIKVRIHQDMDMSNVLLTQFHGRKRVILISPEYSELLYRLPFNTHSLVDLDNPDYDKYPGLRYVEGNEYILEPGDALFMPSGYWHYITYLDGGFAVSYRKIAASFAMKLTGLLSLTVYMPFDKLMDFIFGKKWLAKKEHIAQIRANKAILKKLHEKGYINVRQKEEKAYFNSELRPGHH